jgi:hypothetical protein
MEHRVPDERLGLESSEARAMIGTPNIKHCPRIRLSVKSKQDDTEHYLGTSTENTEQCFHRIRETYQVHSVEGP